MHFKAGKYTLVPRTVNGKEVWYYWFMENGKQVRKSTRCKKEYEAKAFLRQLMRKGEEKESITLKEFTEEFLSGINATGLKSSMQKERAFLIL